MTKQYLYTLLVLIIGLVLVWNTCHHNDQNENQNSAGKKLESKSATHKSTNQKNRIEDKRAPTQLEKIRDFLKDADTQISFYGRVIDQDGVGVQGAAINYQLERAGKLMADGNITNNNQKARCLSANDGSFSIQGAKGLTLTILSIEKKDYRDGKQNLRSFGYRGTPDLHDPDLKNPIDFLLISNSIPKTKIIYNKDLVFSWNKGPVEIPILNIGKIIIIPKRDWKPAQLENFDWQLEISIDGAELVEIEIGHAKIAPIEGYQKSFKYGSKKNDIRWGGAVRRHYAFRTNSGLYGFIDLMFRANREDRAQSTDLEVRLNESGSRNLD
jgi:hypothetical protein